MRKYAEFFTDFCIQESSLVKVEPYLLACGILAATRKHLNFETVWSWEIQKLTGEDFSSIRKLFLYIDERYARSFPDSVINQENIVAGRQRLEPI